MSKSYTRRPSAQRMSEMMDSHLFHGRKSRLDTVKRSGIPRPSKGGSQDRISGVHPIEGSCLPPSSVYRNNARHRSADSVSTSKQQRSRSESAHQPGSNIRQRAGSTIYRETPSQKTPLSRNTLSMQTPTSAMSIRNTGGNQRTPSSERRRSRLGILEKALNAKPGKDLRAITSVEWQRGTCARVVEHLRSDPQAAAVLPGSAAPLKPITIRLFVDLVNILLGKEQVNLTNYVEKLPNIARVLLYPAPMTKSLLKSVNAMHTYPQMLAFLSYLVDVSQIKEMIAQNMTLEKLYGDGEKGQLAILKSRFFFKCWFEFQQSEQFDPLVEDYITDLKELRGVSEKDLQRLEADIKSLRRELEDPEAAEERRREQELRSQMTALKEQARARQARYSQLKQQLHDGAQHLATQRNSLHRAQDITTSLMEERDSLKCRLAKQKMTVRQRDEIAMETERYVEANDYKQTVIDDIEKILFTKDIELAKVRRMALQATNTFNRTLVSAGVAAGKSLAAYSIEERDLLAEHTPSSIRDTITALQALKEDAEAQLQSARQQKEAGASRKQHLRIQVESERQHVELQRSELTVLKSDLEELQQRGAEEASQRHRLAQESLARCHASRERLRQAQAKRTDTLTQFKHMEVNDAKWCEKLEQLKGQEELAREAARLRSQTLVKAYIQLAQNTLNSINTQLEVKRTH